MSKANRINREKPGRKVYGRPTHDRCGSSCVQRGFTTSYDIFFGSGGLGIPGQSPEDGIPAEPGNEKENDKEIDMMGLSNKRILIVKPSSLGDVVHTLPLVHALKRNYPSCFIGWIVQKGFQGIIESDPAIDEIIPISIPSTSDPQAPRGALISAASATIWTLRNLRKRFKDRPYDLVLDLHASFRSGLLALANPGGVRIGLRDAKELNTLFQHHLVGSNPDNRHTVDKNLSFADYLGCSTLPEDHRIVVDPKARERIKEFLHKNGVAEGARLVYANPVARWATKLWTVDGWAELADLLIRRAGVAVVFAGSPADAVHISAISEQMKNDL